MIRWCYLKCLEFCRTRKIFRKRILKVDLRIIVGLGNPGTAYEGTRHNIGFDVIDRLADFLQVKVSKKKFGCLFAEADLEGKKLILLKPQQFMNCSGQAVATAAGFYKTDISQLLVITDDMALEAGVIRLRSNGSAGGHNGLNDIIAKLGRDDFSRLRIGIDKPVGIVARDYVLSRPDSLQREKLQLAVERAKECVFCWVNEGVESAMNRFNAKLEDR